MLLQNSDMRTRTFRTHEPQQGFRKETKTGTRVCARAYAWAGVTASRGVIWSDVWSRYPGLSVTDDEEDISSLPSRLLCVCGHLCACAHVCTCGCFELGRAGGDTLS